MLNIKTAILNIEEAENNSSHKRQVFASCDGNYFDMYAGHFLTSININSPGMKVIIEVINPNADFAEKIAFLKNNLRAIDITVITTTASLRFCSPNKKAAFYACNRFVSLYEYIKANPLPTLFLDIDCFIRKDLSPLFSLYSKTDIAIYTRLHRDKISRKILAGTIYFNGSYPPILDFLHELRNKLKYTELEWFKDQEQIFMTLTKFADIVRISDLKKEFIDFDFDEESTIWTGKGERKNENDAYLSYMNELDKYIFESSAKACILLLADAYPANSKEYIMQHYFAKIYLEAHHAVHSNAKIILCNKADLNDAFLSKLPYDHIYIPYKIDSKHSAKLHVYIPENASTETLMQKTISVTLAAKRSAILPNKFYKELSSVLTENNCPILPASYFTPDSHLNHIWQRKRNISNDFFTRLKLTLARLFVIKKLKRSYFKNKTVALVGNGKSLLNSSNGREIDDHDIVIRFNLGYPYTAKKNVSINNIPDDIIQSVFKDERVFPAEQHYIIKNNIPAEMLKEYTNIDATGQKTTIWVCATVDQSRQALYSGLFKNALYLWPHQKSFGSIHKKLYAKRIHTINSKIYDFFRAEGANPSSGLLLFEFLRNIKDMKSLTLYGFDFFSSGHQVRENELFLSKKEGFPHNKNFEKDYILANVAEDPRLKIK